MTHDNQSRSVRKSLEAMRQIIDAIQDIDGLTVVSLSVDGDGLVSIDIDGLTEEWSPWVEAS